jgi:hypothetical protein
MQQSVSGVVTVGPESAKLLSKKLGRKVYPGEQFDVGVLSHYHPKFSHRLWWFLKNLRYKNHFSKPLQ